MCGRSGRGRRPIARLRYRPKLQRRNGGLAIGTGIEGCTKDETDAKNELAKRWSQFGASEKKFCDGESSTAGEQSYVELLTCLEMSSGQLSASGHQIQ